MAGRLGMQIDDRMDGNPAMNVLRSIAWRKIAVAALVVALIAAAGCRRKKYENPITVDTVQPDKVLFDKAIRDIEKGRYEIARLTLNTLMNTYDSSEFLAKSKLAIADSWMREGGSHALAQAEAEYKDFILFYPTLEESAEAQGKICDLHFRQMEKPDRDSNHALRAEQECRQLLTQFPNSRFAPIAAQRLRQIQEVIGESEYRVGAFYHHKGSFAAAANRLQAVTNHYPLYSGSDVALWKLGESYSGMPPRFRQRSIEAFQKLVREYPLSALHDQAKQKLTEFEAEIPEPDPVAVARMRYEIENATSRSMMGKVWGVFSKSPDTTKAAKSGQPTMTALRPTIPASVPVPAGGQAGVTDVTISTGATDTTALDTQPDARLSQQPGAQPAAAEPAATAPPPEAAKPETAAAKPSPAAGKKSDGKKKKEQKKR
jgi:outer membrane protein assembly factor BamD